MDTSAWADDGVPLHPFEQARLESLRDFEPLLAEEDTAMRGIAKEARDLCGASIGVVSLVGAAEERVLASVGVEPRSLTRRESFCAYAILQPDVLVVEDLTKDVRFQDLPRVVGPPHLRFYAGAPIRDVTGLALGAVCAMHTQPRHASAECIRALARLAEVASAVLETRLLVADGRARLRPEFATNVSQTRLDRLLLTLAEPPFTAL